MKKNYLLLLLLIPFLSHSQTPDSAFYDEKDYAEVRRGNDEGYPFVIIYINQRDTNYKLKKLYYFDSTYMGNSYNKTFYYKNIPDGPYVSVINGQVSSKGTCKNDKHTGEKLTYTDGVLIRKAYFDNGVKVGTWEEYDKKGN